MYIRFLLSAVILGAAVTVAALPIGPAPAMGPFLEPTRGVWGLSRAASQRGNSEVELQGLAAEARVIYDRRGVPHIFASSMEDAVRALGYVVARDRLFQMHLQSAAGSGRLTEIVGARALPMDRETRRLGLPWGAERKIAAVKSSPETSRLMSAYAEGVNAYASTLGRGAVPLEFRLLGSRIPAWDSASTANILMRMGWTLAHITPEVSRAAAASRVGWRAAAALFPGALSLQEPIQPTGAGAPRFDTTPLPPPGAGDTTTPILTALTAGLNDDAFDAGRFASNNWAVSPRRSATGKALLAGDPHLELTLPSIWYEVHIVVPGEVDVYGVTIPGTPGVIIGLNRDIAWTFTNTGADVLDFYAEQVDDGELPARYMVDGEWQTIERRIEEYRSPAGDLLATDTLLFTHRGPLQYQGGRWISFRWTVLEPTNELEAFFRASKSTTAREFLEHTADHFRAPAQNMLVADRHGTIGIRSTGAFPVRPGDGDGLVIRDGSRSSSDWTGYLPRERYPQAVDPAQGFVASANQQPVDPATSTDYFGGDYEPWRALRINRILREDSAVTVDAMRRYQTDPINERARFFLPYFTSIPESEGARLLGGWDGSYTTDNRRAVLFEAAMRELAMYTWDELLREEGNFRSGRVATPGSDVLARLMTDSTSEWWDIRSTIERERRDDIVRMALDNALATLQRDSGEPGDDRWLWSNVRRANVNHLLRLPSFSARDIPVQGGPGNLSPSFGDGTHGASWRMVVELGDEVRGWGIYPGGQSGSPVSDRYRDRVARWQAGELDELIFPRRGEEITQPSATVILRPAARGAR
jgi:penicillin G amidase